MAAPSLRQSQICTPKHRFTSTLVFVAGRPPIFSDGNAFLAANERGGGGEPGEPVGDYLAIKAPDELLAKLWANMESSAASGVGEAFRPPGLQRLKIPVERRVHGQGAVWCRMRLLGNCPRTTLRLCECHHLAPPAIDKSVRLCEAFRLVGVTRALSGQPHGLFRALPVTEMQVVAEHSEIGFIARFESLPRGGCVHLHFFNLASHGPSFLSTICPLYWAQ